MFFIDRLDSLNVPAQPTVSSDSSKVFKSALKSKVTYSARDSIRFEVENQKVYLYGDAHVTYEDTKLDAEQIILDTKNNFVTANGIIDSTGKACR